MRVLLTGGSRGIGAATARALYRDGAEVVLTYVNARDEAEALVDELGERAEAVRCDLADHESLPLVVQRCVERLGGIDVLINNGAVFEENPFFDNDYDSWRRGWERTFAVNVFGTANLTYLALQQMRAQGYGKVLNVASRAAHRGELTFADYGSSKAAVVNLTKSIARSCAPFGITSIAIAPGFIETDMANEELSRRRSEIEGEIPLRRVGSPENVADIIAFFATPKGDYANGATIDINGGSYVR